jgi:hypothetical protein
MQWQANYGVFSVSPRDKLKVIDYIRNRKQHRADQTLWDETETTHVLLETANEPDP